MNVSPAINQHGDDVQVAPLDGNRHCCLSKLKKEKRVRGEQQQQQRKNKKRVTKKGWVGGEQQFWLEVWDFLCGYGSLFF
jgi:hypothetical protein